MIAHIWSVVCSRAVVDEAANNLSLHNVVEQLTVSGATAALEGLPAKLELVTLWARAAVDQPGTAVCRVTFITPSAHTRQSYQYSVDLRDHHRLRHRLLIEKLTTREPGMHHFLIEFKCAGDRRWRVATRIPLLIIHPERETSPA